MKRWRRTIINISITARLRVFSSGSQVVSHKLFGTVLKVIFGIEFIVK